MVQHGRLEREFVDFKFHIAYWVRFFLQAVIQTAEKGKETFQRILDLRKEVDAQIITLGRRAENAHTLICHLYQEPSLTVNQATKLLNIRYAAANQLIGSLVNLGILKEETDWQRNRLFVFRRYIDLFSDEK